MSPLSSGQALVSEQIILDGRLALFHQRQRWLAVADLHFGYEISQRVAGRLIPMWGMDLIEARLRGLMAQYRPEHLVILGDLVHDRAAAEAAERLLTRLARVCETIVVAGNHDRHLPTTIARLSHWEADGFHFHHGHGEMESGGRIQIIGHHHPAGHLADGAGLRLKLPAFVQEAKRWIMPAFSPWAAGTAWRGTEENRLWLCSEKRVLLVPPSPKAATS